jgi:hypothetical protein
MLVISIQRKFLGDSIKAERDKIFITPNNSAGIFLLALKILSEISPEEIVPTIPKIELTEIIELASRVE